MPYKFHLLVMRVPVFHPVSIREYIELPFLLHEYGVFHPFFELTCVIVGMIANPFSIFLFRFSTWLALVVKCFSFVLHVH